MKQRKFIGGGVALLVAFVCALCVSLFVEPVTAQAAELSEDNAAYWGTLTNPEETADGDVTLTVVTTDGETEVYQYDLIMDAVQKLFSYMNHGDAYQTTTSYTATTSWYCPEGKGYNWSDASYTWDYESAVISFTGEHCEYITTSVQFKSSTSGWVYANLDNVTFDGNGTGSIVGDPDQSWTGGVVVSGGTYGNSYGYGSYSNLKGTLTISGDNCVVQNIDFIGNHTWAFTYYTKDNAIGVDGGVTGLTIQNNTFSGYTLVTAFGQNGGTVTDEVFTNNTVTNCLFLFHTADGGATNLTITNNTLTGSAEYTLASCMAYTTIADFSGNTLTYASFGLQNCDIDMSQFLTKNTYDHGYIYQETVDYSSGLGYYYHPSSTTVMTILPDGVDRAVWISDYDVAGEMDSALTYTQQDAIDAAAITCDDLTLATLTWTGGGTDEDGSVQDGGVAIGYNYTALHLDYEDVPDPVIEKTPEGSSVEAGDVVSFKLAVTVPSDLGNYIAYDSDGVGTVGPTSPYTLTFYDEMDDVLSFNKDVVVSVGDVVLDSSYYLVTSESDQSFEVAIDLFKLYTDGIITEADFDVTSITVTYTATVSEDAEAGEYGNSAWASDPFSSSDTDSVTIKVTEPTPEVVDESDNTTTTITTTVVKTATSESLPETGDFTTSVLPVVVLGAVAAAAGALLKRKE